MKAYNGHRSWNCWNVSLWLYNDEGLYNLLLDAIEYSKKEGKPRQRLATARIYSAIGEEKTPDGGLYNLTAIREVVKAEIAENYKQ